MTAIVERPAPAVETPDAPELTPSAVAPLPECCPNCGGDGWEPHDEQIRCLVCDGTGTAGAVEFRLLPTRTYQWRVVTFEQTTRTQGRMRLETAQKPKHRKSVEHYDLAEIGHDDPGVRGFVCAKIGTPRLHHIEVGAGWCRCDCEGGTYLTSARANERAAENGDETFAGCGCKHADAVLALLRGKWFE